MSIVSNLLLAVVLSAQAAPAPAASPVDDHPMIGEAAPAFSLPDLAGDEITLDSLRGTFLVIHFGTSW